MLIDLKGAKVLVLSTGEGGQSVPGNYYEVGGFVEVLGQPSPALDTRAVVRFGPAASDALGIVSVDAAGEFTVLKSGPIAIKQRIRVTRPNNAGVAEVYFQAQFSPDGGATWLASGRTQHEAIDEGGDTDIFLDVSFLEVVAGVKLRATWAMSSPGASDAVLDQSTPSQALLDDGMESVGSAETIVYAVRGATYV